MPRAREVRVTLGADPEFELVRDGDVLYAEDVLRMSTRARIGVDGAGYQLELRPEPGKTSEDLVKNLRKLFKRFKKEHPDLQISVKGSTYPLGGHIHLGYYDESGKAHQLIPSVKLLQMLDEIVGRPSASKNGTARAQHGYANMSAAAPKVYGFEYRTPPATIFCKPHFLELFSRLAQSTFSFYLAHKSAIEEGTMGSISSISEQIKTSVLSVRDKEILREFSSYRLTDENIIQYWA